MPAIKDVSQIAEKYTRVTPGRATEYAQGVQNPRADWQAATAAAETNWAQGVQQAVQKKTFGQGVRKAGSEKWKRKATELGTQRYGPGVAAAGTDYAQGFAPYAAVIQGTTLPPRYPKGDPRNYQRVQAMGEALRKKKMGG